MVKKVVSTALLALLPMVAVHADNNVTKHPFVNPFANDPFFQDFQKLQTDMDKLLNNFHKRAFSHMPQIRMPRGFDSGFSSTFKTDINDRGDHYEIVADLPGMDKAKIDVKAENGMLSINAESETKIKHFGFIK
jgi:HSP20 family molecular chaperone IbpA